MRLASSPEDLQRSAEEREEKEDELLQLSGPHPSACRVRIDENGHLVWPVIFLYPEHGQSDLIEAFHEHST